MIKQYKQIDPLEPYSYGTNKYLLSEKEEIKSKNIIKQYKYDKI